MGYHICCKMADKTYPLRTQSEIPYLYEQFFLELAGGVLECNLAHRRSVAELCMLFKIRSKPMHPLSSALPLPYVPARVARTWCFGCS